jgi:4-hydroxybenzoate polyprenyltransferase
LVLRINLQILIISWWLGAATALLSFLLPIYTHHILVGGIGWSIISISTILIIYEIKKIKEEDKRTKAL